LEEVVDIDVIDRVLIDDDPLAVIPNKLTPPDIGLTDVEGIDVID
jgi:hypothetical protein